MKKLVSIRLEEEHIDMAKKKSGMSNFSDAIRFMIVGEEPESFSSDQSIPENFFISSTEPMKEPVNV